jgi:hypothetical protein
MLDLYAELLHIIRKLEQESISYALCGGLALAVYDIIRATVDIDLLILTQDVERAKKAMLELGFDLKAQPMSLAGGKVLIHRVSKIDPGSDHPLSVDFLLVTDDLEGIWSERKKIELEEESIWVVSKPGLVHLKKLRNSAQDREDIQRLGEDNETD